MGEDFIYTTYPLPSARLPASEVTFATKRQNNDRYSVRVRNSWKMEAHYMLASEILRAGDWFIDAGANIGTFAFPVAKQTGSLGILVEALPENCDLLQVALGKNSDVNLTVVNAAVGLESGEIYIGGTSAYAKTTVSNEGGEKVEQISLGDAISMVPRRNIKLLKVDVEGSELDAFRGAEEFLASDKIEYIIYESNGPVCQMRGYTVRDLRRALVKFGYHLYTIVGHKLIPTTEDEFQYLGNADLLAVKKPLQALGSFVVQDIDEQTVIKHIRRCFLDLPPQYAEFMRAELNCAPSHIRNHDEVAKHLGA